MSKKVRALIADLDASQHISDLKLETARKLIADAAEVLLTLQDDVDALYRHGGDHH